MDCRLHGRRSVGNPNVKVRCWTYDQIGHPASNYHTLRCFTCGGVGHKAQVCGNPRRQFMRRLTYSPASKANEKDGTNDEKTEVNNKVWVKKNVLLDQNEDQYTKGDDGCHMASHT